MVCEGAITEIECFEALMSTPNDKTPGSDGLSANFYKCYWNELKALFEIHQNIFFDSLQSKLFRFIWSNKKDRIKRKILYNDIGDGGLKMIHTETFCQALKIAWVKRILDKENEGNWKMLFYINMNKIGGDYILQCNFTGKDLDKRLNNFWKDVLTSWSHYRYFNPVKYKDIFNQSLWNNSYIKIDGKTIFFEQWFEAGILYVKDIIKNNGLFKTFHELQDDFNLPKRCYLEYFSLISCFRKEWKNTLRSSVTNDESDDVNSLKRFISYKKVTKSCYLTLIKKHCLDISDTNQCEKWSNDLNVDLSFLIQWQNRFLTTNWVTLDSKIRMFQYKFIHRRISTNEYLFKIGVKNSPLCNFCKTEPQTLIHLFCLCPIVSKFWTEVNTWLNFHNISYHKFSNIDICFGVPSKFQHLSNTIILFAKYFIFRTKCQEGQLSLAIFINELKFVENVEKFIAFKKGKEMLHYKKWRPFTNFEPS
nr:uncharacterized protein LOC129261325 [Lytechinus pictus]